MNERHMFCSNQQAPYSDNGRHVQNDRHSEPYTAQGNAPIFRRSNTYQVSPPSEFVNRSDLHYLPDHVSRPATANHPAPGVRAFHVPLSYGFVSNLPSSSYYNGNVLPVNEHGMSNYSEFGVRDSWTESAMGIPGNFYQLGESARPSTSAAPLTSCHFGPWSASMEAPFCLPGHRGYGNPPTREAEARHRSDTVGLHMDPFRLSSYNNLPLQGYCVDQSFLPYCAWLDQQSISNAGDLPWNGPPMMPYCQGSNVQGVSSELSNSGLPIYPERSINRGSANFLHSSPVSLQHPNHHPSQNTPTNQPRPLDLSRFRSRIEDHVLILKVHNDDENSTDHHVNSDVDNISYEELLDLTERIGTVSNGVTEEVITHQLKTRQYSATVNNQDHDSCIICQDEYEVNDKLGILECGHEFHLHCLKKWLLIKNVCPLCKSAALVT